VVVDRSDIDDCQILQSFVLGGIEATRIHYFGTPLISPKTTSIIFLVVVDRSDIDDCQILQSFVLGGIEATRIHDFGTPLLFRKTEASMEQSRSKGSPNPM
jgi:hypothetical protein